jgi:hypothetical protein
MTIAGVTGTEVCGITVSTNIEDYIDNNIKEDRQSFCQIVHNMRLLMPEDQRPAPTATVAPHLEIKKPARNG